MLVTGRSYWYQHCGGKCSFCVFVCLLFISVRASFVLVTQKATGNPWMIRRPWYPFPPLLLIFAHSCVHKQTYTQYLCLLYSHWNTESTKTHFLPTVSLANTHAKTPVLWYDEHLLSDIMLIFPKISFLNATPLTIELLSVPAIGHLYGDSCQVTAVKTAFLWC